MTRTLKTRKIACCLRLWCVSFLFLSCRDHMRALAPLSYKMQSRRRVIRAVLVMVEEQEGQTGMTMDVGCWVEISQHQVTSACLWLCLCLVALQDRFGLGCLGDGGVCVPRICFAVSCLPCHATPCYGLRGRVRGCETRGTRHTRHDVQRTCVLDATSRRLSQPGHNACQRRMMGKSGLLLSIPGVAPALHRPTGGGGG